MYHFILILLTLVFSSCSRSDLKSQETEESKKPAASQNQQSESPKRDPESQAFLQRISKTWTSKCVPMDVSKNGDYGILVVIFNETEFELTGTVFSDSECRNEKFITMHRGTRELTGTAKDNEYIISVKIQSSGYIGLEEEVGSTGRIICDSSDWNLVEQRTMINQVCTAGIPGQVHKSLLLLNGNQLSTSKIGKAQGRAWILYSTGIAEEGTK